MGFYNRYGFSRWAPYVPVAQRRRNAEAQAKKMAKKGKPLSPVNITGRMIADTFWGRAWCDNLEKYCDFENRMPRGRTYARNGSVIDLQILDGKITSLVSGSDLYKIEIKIDQLTAAAWKALCKICSKEVTSLLDLMRGKLSPAVIERLTNPKQGMFPKPKELHVRCSCPDYARMCKHIAATLYGVGHRLDTVPELFFKLRGVEQLDLVSQALKTQKTKDVIGIHRSSSLDGEDLGTMFGIDLIDSAEPALQSQETSKHENQPTPRRSIRANNTTRKKSQTPPKSKLISKVDKNSKRQSELSKPSKTEELNGDSSRKSARSSRSSVTTAKTKSSMNKLVHRDKPAVAKKTTVKKKVAKQVTVTSSSVKKASATASIKKAAKRTTKISSSRSAPLIKTSKKAR